MKIRQRRVSRKQKGSRNRGKAQNKVTALHNKIQQKREAYQWWVAKKIVGLADSVAVEDLQVKNMMKRCKPVKFATGRFLPNNQAAKRGLNRSIAYASWYGLTQKLEYVAVKSGKKLYRVNPQYTSQTCSKCKHVDKESRNGEKFICTNCGNIDDANLQAARNVRTKAIESYGLTIARKARIRSKTVRRDSPEPVQLSIFDVRLYERLPDNKPPKGKRLVGENSDVKQLSIWDVEKAIS